MECVQHIILAGSCKIIQTTKGPSCLEFGSRTPHTLQGKSRSKTTTPKCPKEDASRSGQGAGDASQADPVRLFPVMMDLVILAHVPLAATSDQHIPILTRGGPYNGARYFPFAYVVRLTIHQHQEGSRYAALRFSIPFPACLLCSRSGTHDERHIDQGA